MVAENSYQQSAVKLTKKSKKIVGNGNARKMRRWMTVNEGNVNFPLAICGVIFIIFRRILNFQKKS